MPVEAPKKMCRDCVHCDTTYHAHLCVASVPEWVEDLLENDERPRLPYYVRGRSAEGCELFEELKR